MKSMDKRLAFGHGACILLFIGLMCAGVSLEARGDAARALKDLETSSREADYSTRQKMKGKTSKEDAEREKVSAAERRLNLAEKEERQASKRLDEARRNELVIQRAAQASSSREQAAEAVGVAQKSLEAAKRAVQADEGVLAGQRKALAASEAALKSWTRVVELAEAKGKDAPSDERRQKALEEAMVKQAASEKDVQAAKAAEQAAAKKVESARAKVAEQTRRLKEAQDKLAKLPGGRVGGGLSLDAARRATEDAQKAYDKARQELTAARENYEVVRPGIHTFYMKEGLSLEDARKVLAKYENNFKFEGDVIWLASTEVDGEPLAASFLGMAPDKGARLAQDRAVRAGFYFAGFKWDDKRGKVVVDKGRLAPIHVKFVKGEGEKKKETSPRLFSVEQIARRFSAGRAVDSVVETNVFNFQTIDKRWRALNGHPDIKRVDVEVKTTGHFAYKREDGTEPPNGEHPRAVTMDVNVQEAGFPSPMHGVFGLDNFGSMGDMESAFGTAESWTARLNLQVLNLWKQDHALTLSGNAALDASYMGFAGSYFIPRRDNWRWYDLSWTLHGGYTLVDDEDVVENLDVEGKGYFGGLQLSKRLVDTTRSTLDLSLGATYRYVESAIDVEYEGEKYKFEMGRNGDGYEILPLSLALMYSDTEVDAIGGMNFATVEYIYNLAGSSLDELRYYRPAIDEDHYSLVRAQMARLQLLNPALLGKRRSTKDTDEWMLFAKVEGQYAFTPLVGAEQFSIGGHNSVRGYAEREFMGDSGIAATLELRTPLIVGFLANMKPVEAGKQNFRYGWDRFQFVVFVDAGYYLLEDGQGTTAGDDDEFIAGVGAGLRVAIRDDAQLRFDWGFPLVRDDESFEAPSSGRGYLSLQVQF